MTYTVYDDKQKKRIQKWREENRESYDEYVKTYSGLPEKKKAVSKRVLKVYYFKKECKRLRDIDIS